MVLLPAFYVKLTLASPALAISLWRRICVSFCVLVTMYTVGLSKIWTHVQSFVEYSALRIKQFFKGLAFCRSLNNGFCFETGNLRKNMGLIFYSAYLDPASVSMIKRLLFARRPFAIFRGIWPVIIFTLKRESLRAVSHVLNESRKTKHPSIANSDTPSAIVDVMFCGWGKAPPSDSFPNGIKRVLVFERHAGIMPYAVK